MTVEEFNTAHGLEWMKLKGRPMFECLLSVIASNSPAKLNAKRPPADVLAGGTLFFAENQGYEQLVDIIENKLGIPVPKPTPSESDYSEPEV